MQFSHRPECTIISEILESNALLSNYSPFYEMFWLLKILLVVVICNMELNL